jgi:hypothetical protein
MCNRSWIGFTFHMGQFESAAVPAPVLVEDVARKARYGVFTVVETPGPHLPGVVVPAYMGNIQTVLGCEM